ncbi:ATP-dependent zinc metalloprotease FtsH [Prevotella lacticifex]|uniref:ATP-dependent zinc metalloprotease FtsH n=1 Tax=Prevotella lacticifex TaxID=2854755 RepID=A0A9R1C966_9BACT|nr:ATP-dependent zinc metalloprotease FtsH [Prevotella lacticifex]GJG35057.1 ATP-dependent zinc metalloprotease FtsH [Prevotella lacticifex]GJG39892.1 ATP-dependent zinc metalloprotease FtsH [Prevotella lacticifex]GJG41426.1 ATP-dependent zinc metalloprotease FtsH [Prevotella lacticifex]GJG46246.1 ATP-dependent zinc metalloprotease FtsH [Prevotella lacticifex]GJG47778.1 ATP-dependent zinc metalloprotease FtsH [Prevotella lacticifex]
MPNTNNENQPKMPKFNMNWIYLFVIIGLGLIFFAGGKNGIMSSSVNVERDYTTFINYVNKGYASNVEINKDESTLKMYVRPEHQREVFGGGNLGQNPYVKVDIGSIDNLENFLNQAVQQKKIAGFSYDNNDSSLLTQILVNVLPWVIIIFVWIWIMRRFSGGGSGSGGIFSVGKSKAKLYEKSQAVGVTFKDVAGQEGAKQEVQEIVDFLKNPKKYTALGGKIPKGALLIGPPGTGKTLLAKAVAGEAGVPFFSMSGSDFVEMFVGVGASRVRDVFRQAKEKAPCIIFIDEIDAVGRARSKNPAMGGNDERENTLNALLTEMDGFGTNSGVIVLAATNRADMLDKALLRAGRFDRQIHVDLPDLAERKAILQVHLRPLKYDKNLDVDFLARQTPGFSGADIANMCNEAALIAARHNKKEVSSQDFLDAVDRIIGGLEKKTKVMTEAEKRAIAIHEAGHATVSWFCKHANPLVKVTIVPRGQALGAAWYLPEERVITTKEEMLDEMCSLLGGRAAEDLFVGQISTGAMNDLERATKSAYGMIAYAGMSDKLPNICYYNNQDYSFQKPYSESTAKVMDSEVLKMINEEYDRAKEILSEHKEGHNALAKLLFEKEVIYTKDVEDILGKRPYKSRSEEILEENEKASEAPKLEDQSDEVKKAQAEFDKKQQEQEEK